MSAKRKVSVVDVNNCVTYSQTTWQTNCWQDNEGRISCEMHPVTTYYTVCNDGGGGTGGGGTGGGEPCSGCQPGGGGSGGGGTGGGGGNGGCYVFNRQTGKLMTGPCDGINPPSSSAISLSLQDRLNYPTLARIVDGLLDKVKSDPKLMEALKKFSYLSEQKILEYLTPGQGPFIIIKEFTDDSGGESVGDGYIYLNID